MIPTLHSARLTLRAPAPGDFAEYARFYASDRACHMGGPLDEKGAWFWFCSDIAHWHLFGHGALMIDISQTGQTIGQVGINAGPLFPETELGWFLYEGFGAQGYATEAARTLRDWAFATLPLTSLVSYTDPENAASIAVAQRLGAVLDRDAAGQDATDLVWRHHRGAA